MGQTNIKSSQKMKLWNDLNNVAILDTNQAGDLLNYLKTIKDIKKTSLSLFLKKNNAIVTISGLREANHTVTGSLKKESIFPLLKNINDYIPVKIDTQHLEQAISIAKEIAKVAKEQSSDFDDPWLYAKIKLINPKNKIFLISSDDRFVKFVKKSELKTKFKNIVKYINVSKIQKTKQLL